MDKQRLDELEKIVEQSDFEKGRALGEIRDERGYKLTHSSWETYCRERWSISRKHADQLIAASKVGTMVPIENVRQARALAPLEDDEKIEVVQEVRDENDGKIPSARVLREKVQKRLQKREPARRHIENEKAQEILTALYLPRNLSIDDGCLQSASEEQLYEISEAIDQVRETLDRVEAEIGVRR